MAASSVTKLIPLTILELEIHGFTASIIMTEIFVNPYGFLFWCLVPCSFHCANSSCLQRTVTLASKTEIEKDVVLLWLEYSMIGGPVSCLSC